MKGPKSIKLTAIEAKEVTDAIELAGGADSVAKTILNKKEDALRNPTQLIYIIKRALDKGAISVKHAQYLFHSLPAHAQSVLNSSHPFLSGIIRNWTKPAPSETGQVWEAQALDCVDRYNRLLSKAVAYQTAQLATRHRGRADPAVAQRKRERLFAKAFEMLSTDNQRIMFKSLPQFIRARQFDRLWLQRYCSLVPGSTADCPHVHVLIERQTAGLFEGFTSSLINLCVKDIRSKRNKLFSLEGILENITADLVAAAQKQASSNRLPIDEAGKKIRESIDNMPLYYLFNSSALGIANMIYFSGIEASPLDDHSPAFSRNEEMPKGTMLLRFILQKGPSRYFIHRIHWFET